VTVRLVVVADGLALLLMVFPAWDLMVWSSPVLPVVPVVVLVGPGTCISAALGLATVLQAQP
jgi:hypothetical protein